MYCSQCGKKVMDTMLFCPFCGSPIVIPSQDNEEMRTAEKPCTGDSAAKKSDFSSPVSDCEAMAVSISEPDMEMKIMENAGCESADQEILPETKNEEKLETEVSLETTEETFSEAPEEQEEFEINEGGDNADAVGGETTFTSLFDEIAEKQSEEKENNDFASLSEDKEDEIESQWRRNVPERMKKTPEMRKDNQIHLDGRAPRLDGRRKSSVENSEIGKPNRRKAATYIPERSLNLEDIFMDDIEEDEYDDFDDGFESAPDVYEFEDDDEGNFFIRHIRGLIGLSLLLVLVMIFFFYGISDGGQATLAQMNLAWRPEAYSKIAYEYYQEQRYDLAGSFYEKALSRDSDNYSYAESAAMAYITGEDTEKAAMMLKKCIEMNPSKAEPYVYLMNLYPDSANRPWDVSQLLLQGYRTTGDERLKAAAQ